MKIKVRTGDANRARAAIEQVQSKATFKTPILAQVYKAVGYSSLLIAVVSLFALIYGILESDSAYFGLGLYGVLCGLVGCLIPLGIAQVIVYIGKAAFFAERCSDALVYLQADSKLQIDLLAQMNPQPTEEQVVTVACPICQKDVRADALTPGENTCPHCTSTFLVN
jgi:hypothetical protein